MLSKKWLTLKITFPLQYNVTSQIPRKIIKKGTVKGKPTYQLPLIPNVYHCHMYTTNSIKRFSLVSIPYVISPHAEMKI